jgi:N-hydroxyarylamine O-acetyltransferase
MRLPEDHTEDISGEYRLFPVRDECWCVSSKSQPLYELTLDEQPLEAFEPMCRYHQSSPESIFSKGLICTRATAGGRITLSRDRLIVVEDGRRTETLGANVAAVLEQHFGISDWVPTC